MERFTITGPTRLEGSVTVAGAKNAALPALAATLLAEQPVVLENLPQVRDIRTMVRLLQHLGVEACEDRAGLELQPALRPVENVAPYDLVKTMRASVLVLGPSVARWGRARVSLPGGCAIGVRPIDQHLAGLEALGAELRIEHGYVTARAKRLRGARFRFSLPTVTGTENLLMAACLADGVTRLSNCAREPEIADLATLLAAMGATIEGAGTETITIEGSPTLGGARHAIPGDRIEAGTYLIGAAITGGDVAVHGARAQDLVALLEVLRESGVSIESSGGAIRARGIGDGEGEDGGALHCPDVTTAPHPGFPTDLQAQFMALATQSERPTTIHEAVFENRFQHAAELTRMGARIRIEGSRARVEGRSRLLGAHVMATDLRASAGLVLAALCAQGETVVDRIYHLDRGYEQMESKLQHLGARVERTA
ncbi:MAG TPA: UDP-N-acetylglucosamine 1-carboxyvinyltransferase [Thermoanaerobaculia bacterium]|nr:UDP-N-acetylglucosamine 1-carboxyvinyltransferase [Thermoanaerobaculia bacterium]